MTVDADRIQNAGVQQFTSEEQQVIQAKCAMIEKVLGTNGKFIVLAYDDQNLINGAMTMMSNADDSREVFAIMQRFLDRARKMVPNDG